MEFIKGMDISTLPEMLDKGFVYRDEDGTPIDPFVLIKKNGVNSVRLRIWNEPENLPESGGYCNLSDTIRMARKIKENGMSFFLDFHYSDWWADPGQQRKPKAWEGLPFQKLVEAVHDYTYTVLKTLEKEEVYPEYVQIGNEIRSGMLFPEGEVRNFPQLAQLINAGIQAVRELDAEHEEGRSMMESLSEEQFPYPEMPVTTGAGNGKGIRKNIPRVKLVIHLDQGGRYQYFENWFDKAIANGVTDFDIIALSYYPFWHGTFAEFRDCMERVIERYHRPVMAAETAHAWRLAEGGFVTEQQVRISGFPASPEGQRRVVELVMNIVASLKNGMGLGVYYWEPLDIPRPGGNGWSASMGIMTADARPTVAMSAFRFVPDARKNRLPVKVLSVIPKEEVSTIKPDFRLRSDAANECIEKNSPRTETKNGNSGQGSSDFGKWLVTEDNWTMLTDSGMGKRCALGEDRSCSSHTLAELLQELKLPKKVRILTFDGKTEIRDAAWTNAELCESGTENTVVCRNWIGTSLQAPFVLTLTGTRAELCKAPERKPTPKENFRFTIPCRWRNAGLRRRTIFRQEAFRPDWMDGIWKHRM